MASPNLRQIIGGNIRRLRMARGMSQEDLAELCGFHRTYIGSIELAKQGMRVDQLERFADALGVEPFELLVPNRRAAPLRSRRTED